MAAGLGFKTFTSGEVLTAADTNGYLMQGVLVFASTAARDAAITSPQEGQFAYLKDTNVTTYYTGSAWANLDTTGMTNPMTTTGDMVYSSSGSTPARLGIGTTGQVVTVAGGIPSWATPASASSGLTLITRQSFSNVATTSTTFDGVFTSTYKRYLVMLETIYAGTSTDDMVLQLRYAGPTTQATTYFGSSMSMPTTGAAVYSQANNNSGFGIATESGSSTKPGSGQISFSHVGNSSQNAQYYGNYEDNNYVSYVFGGGQDTARTYTGFIMSSSSSNITGTLSVYGLATS